MQRRIATRVGDFALKKRENLHFLNQAMMRERAFNSAIGGDVFGSLVAIHALELGPGVILISKDIAG